jgi:hypothetical protein
MSTITILDSTGTTKTAALVTNTGQATSANSLPVVIASDQTAVPVSATGLTSGTQLTQIAGNASQTSAGIFASIGPDGGINIDAPAAVTFTDPFDGSVINTTNWTVQTGGAGSVTQGTIAGTLSLNSGTTALGYAAIFTKQAFAPHGVSFDSQGGQIGFEFPLLANVTRFFGRGTVPATPTAAVPITDGYGYLQTAQALSAVVYASGAQVQSVALTVPADANQHVYAMATRAGAILLVGDNFAVPLGVLTATPSVQTLPICALAIAGATGPAAGQVMTVGAVGLGDTGHNANQLADGTYPWVQGAIKQSGIAPLTTDNALVVATSPNSAPPADRLTNWSATSGVTALATTTSTALKSAGAAGIRNYVSGMQIYNTSATVSTTVSILDGAAVIWTGFLPATTSALPIVPSQVVFPTSLRGTAATAMNIQLGTTAASVYYNVQGYQAS